MKEIKELKDKYINGEDDIGRDFIEPCLRNCISWRRTTYGFSSGALKAWAGAFTNIIKDCEKIEILTCITANSQDKVLMKALEHCSTKEERSKTLRIHSENILITAFAADNTNDKSHFTQNYGWKLLHYLLATEKLVLKFGINTISDHDFRLDKYHEKSGYFVFEDDTTVAHYGSFNESESGHKHNNESVMVFKSFDGSNNFAEITKRDVDKDWEGTPYLEVHPLSKETLKKIRKYAPKNRPKSSSKGNGERTVTIDQNIWEHKKRAIEIFLEKKNGILEMATGTGKTKTALEVARVLYLQGKIDSIICTTSGNDLLDQWFLEFCEWVEENKELNKLSIYRHYKDHRDKDTFLFNNKNKILLLSRRSQNLIDILNSENIDKESKGRCLIIHDEIHGFGSDTFKKIAGTHAEYIYKLGLSATPERLFDKDGNDFIKKEIGPTIYEYTVGQAIEDSILCPFDYYPVAYNLTQEERHEKQKLVKRLQIKDLDYEDREKIFRDISNINKNAELKLDGFREFISSKPELLKNTIIFVNTTKQGNSFIPSLSRYTQDYKTYFQGEDSIALKRFAEGRIECLIACHRVSEGIDIQSLNNIFLISSDASSLETIQRMGRCLRTDPNNPTKRANIIDFVLDFNGRDNLDEEVTDHRRALWLSKLSEVEAK